MHGDARSVESINIARSIDGEDISVRGGDEEQDMLALRTVSGLVGFNDECRRGGCL
jgi:hypothetical protein